MSAALAYYTIFSIAPILILIISVAQAFYGREAVEGEVYGQIRSFVGENAAQQIQQIIANSALSHEFNFTTMLSIGVLIFSATGVFGEIQDSINTIWRLKPKPKKGWLKMLVNRLLSFSMVISLAFLLLVSLVIETLLDALGTRLAAHFPETSIVVAQVLNWIISLAVITLLFGGIFKVLPDARIKWKHVIAGALATGVLFLLGKWGIGFYLGRSKVGTVYGAAGSMIIVLLWVYYSAIILYFGAEFTRHYAQWRGSRIFPNDYAVWVDYVELESKSILPESEVTDAAAKEDLPAGNKPIV